LISINQRKAGKSRKRTDNLCERLKTEFVDLFLRSEDDSGSTIVEVGSVGSGDSSVLLEDGFEGRNLVGLDLLVLLILRDDDIACSSIRDGHRSDLVGESTGLPRLGSFSVRFEAVLVLIFSGDLVLLGSLLSAVDKTLSVWLYHGR